MSDEIKTTAPLAGDRVRLRPDYLSLCAPDARVRFASLRGVLTDRSRRDDTAGNVVWDNGEIWPIKPRHLECESDAE